MAEKYSVIPETTGGIITEHSLKNLTNFDVVGNDGIYKELIIAKVVSILVLGIVSFLIGLSPLQLAKWFHWNYDIDHNTKNSSNLVISLLLCFGCGVLMFTTFIHLQPEVREEFESLREQGKAPDFEQFADLVFCMGFFFVYLIEEIVHGILDRKHDHADHDSFFHRSVSLRSCAKGKDGTGDGNQGIIPRVSLNQNGESKPTELGPKSISTQGLLDSSSVSAIQNSNGSLFEQSYPTRFSSFDAESQMVAGQYGRYSPKMNDSINGKDLYDSNIQTVGKVTPRGSHAHTGHSHGFYEDNPHAIGLANTFRNFFTVLALSFHAVFEGLAVGLENEVSNVWYLFLAIATHKFVIAFCVGVDLISTKTKTLLILLYLGTFAFVTPLGIGIGIGLSNDPSKSGTELSTVILQGMAAGTLLYVVFFEVLQREKANNQSGILQLIAILAGFGVMFALQFISGPHHHHHHHYENVGLPQGEAAGHEHGGNDHQHHGHSHHHHHH